jgi:hypothetical protein
MWLRRRGSSLAATEPDRRPARLLPALAIVTAAILARSLVFLLYQQSFFDSDQAIIGLMAKHLIEGRAFPLFYYGQIYLLGIDAWFAVPFFLALGPTVFALHLSVVTANLIAAWLLLVGLVRWGGLRPVDAALALSFFTFAPPLTAASLIEAGANIWPFVVVPLLWMLRDRPVWFGVTLALGVLYREFTLYAVIAIVAGEVWTTRLWQPARVRMWALAAVVAIGVWAGVQGLKPYADLMGPGTSGRALLGADYTQLGTLLSRFDVAPSDYPARTAAMFGSHLPRLFGAEHVEQAIATQGHGWLFWALAIALPVLVVRALLVARREGFASTGFAWYLLGVGLLAAFGFIATRPATEPTERYYLLALFIPVGVVAASLAVERARLWRLATMAVVACWLAGSAIDHVGQVRRYWGGAVPDDIRVLADGLVERGITVAKGGYWRAYKVTFLTRERVKVATTEVVRIREYQDLADEAGPDLVHISERPCERGEPLGLWFLCRE